ncbi:2,3-bisphosphoglycerate-independent phosphoglycerate mutase [Poriferisphaera sp. WC338]|uniref:2,3-bisphosphoglycerate-independent phosphoglycerate mutase n=1 Tax=Poriferisphaera sp. WC338 TaxID=3425129 RepID=UPI003D8180EB
MSESAKPVVLIVRDGWGFNPNESHDEFNAIKLANTPRGDELLAKYPWTLIHTSGEDVGLNDGTMGNSEVGHQNIGAGRIVNQESVRITKSIRDGSFFENKAMVEAVDRAKANDGTVHLLGIASDAGVHGLLTHLFACIELCKKRGQKKVAIHLFCDGRDTGPFTGKGYIEQIVKKCDELGVGQVASVIGRYYAMDRDNRWERVKMAYDLFTKGETNGEVAPNYDDALTAVQGYYDNPTNDSQNGDEFIMPRTVGDAESTRIKDGDSVIFYNYRGDRPREITRAFMQPDFYGNVLPSPDSGEKGFDRGKQLDLKYVCMTAYDESFKDWPNLLVAYVKPPKMANIGGEYLSKMGKTQFRCAETEKFPHVTFFCNDYREEPFPGEGRQMAQSPKVATYDLQPEMSAPEIKQIVLDRINAADGEDFILVNFANGDMVGHTGKLDAAIKAVETVDTCVGEIVDATLAKGGKLIVTADHGNAEQMFNPDTNAPHTAHTLYDVECIVVGADLEGSDVKLREGGRLADVMPTALKLLGLDQPAEMTGQSLI